MSPTTFFHLPRELRNQIYGLLVATTRPFRIHADTNITLIARCPWGGSISPYPPWLIASKAIQREGIEYIQRIGGIRLYIKKDTWWAEDHYNTGIWGAFQPLQMRTLDVILESRQSNPPGSDPKLRGNLPYQIPVTAMSYLAHLLNDISGTGALQDLIVTTSVGPSNLPTPKQVQSAFRSVLPQLRSFEYDIQLSRYSRDGTAENVELQLDKLMNTKELSALKLLDQRPPTMVALMRNRLNGVRLYGRAWRLTWWKEE